MVDTEHGRCHTCTRTATNNDDVPPTPPCPPLPPNLFLIVIDGPAPWNHDVTGGHPATALQLPLPPMPVYQPAFLPGSSDGGFLEIAS